jgi:hypothetical protein
MLTTSRVALASVLATLALLAGGLAPASASGSAEPDAARAAVRNYYGAIALNIKNGYASYSYDYRTKRKAIYVAYHRCRAKSGAPSYCRKVVWVRNYCAATVVRWTSDGSIYRYAWGGGRTKRKAIRAAHAKLSNARLRVWVCTTR